MIPLTYREQWVWQHDDWLVNPAFNEYSAMFSVAEDLTQREHRLLEYFRLRWDLCNHVAAQALIENVRDSFAIEGERLDERRLRLSVAEKLNMDVPGWKIRGHDHKSRESSAVGMTLNLLADTSPLSVDRLCALHAEMRPFKEIQRQTWGALRSLPEYVREGERIVYIAPPPKQVRHLTERFCEWWNHERISLPTPIGAAYAHAFFVAIHPFEDGNGRMARGLHDKALSTNTSLSYRPYTISRSILVARAPYYQTLDDFANGHGIHRFLELMLQLQDREIQRAAGRVRALEKLDLWLRRLEERNEYVSPLMTAMLKAVALEPNARSWDAFEASGNIDDVGDEDPWEAWEHLKKLGIVSNTGLENIETHEPLPRDSQVSRLPLKG